MPPQLSIVAPCFNEEEIIESVVKDWMEFLRDNEPDSEVVITEDGSTDRTREILDKLRTKYPNLRVVCNDQNSGYGAALLRAIQSSSGKLVLTIDSDGQFDASDYLKLKETMQSDGADFVSGYRKTKRDSFIRVLADKALRLIVRVFFGIRLHDPNCALKLLNGDLARSLVIEATGYPTPTEICIRVSELGYRSAERMVAHHDRRGGLSKLKLFRTGFKALFFLAYLFLKLKLHRRRIISRF